MKLLLELNLFHFLKLLNVIWAIQTSPHKLE